MEEYLEEVPKKISFFILRLAHDRLLTNSVRVRRNISDDSSYPPCVHHFEDAIHALRDCED